MTIVRRPFGSTSRRTNRSVVTEKSSGGGWTPFVCSAATPRSGAGVGHVPSSTDECGPGLGEALAVWALFAADAAAIFCIHARLPLGPGWAGPGVPAAGARQVGTFVRHPLGLAAVPLGLLALGRVPPDRVDGALGRAVVVAAAIAIAAPWRRRGVGVSRDTRAAVAGATAALVVTVEAVRLQGVGGFAPWRRGDSARLGIGLALFALSLPWLLADVGVYVGDVPGLRAVYLSRQRLPAIASGPAVHLGHHHGMDGALLAWSALALSRQVGAIRHPFLREVTALVVAGLLPYGLARAAEDAWYEQVVKRGMSSARIPPLVVAGRPTTPRGWLMLLAATALLHRRLRRRDPASILPGGPVRRSPAGSLRPR